MKLQSYALGNKLWLSSKYLKTKWNYILDVKFLGLFQILHSVDKKTYKLKLPEKWRIHDIFYILLLE